MQITKRKSYNTLKWVLGILSAVFLMLYITSIHLTNKFKPLIKRELKDLVLSATDSLYSIEFSDLKANLITRTARLEDVKIIPDTAIFKKLIAERRAPNNIYYVELSKLSIKNFHPKRLFKFRRLNIDQILFDNPDVVMVNKQFDFNESKPTYLQRSPYDYISKYLKELRVNTIDFKDIKFKYIDNNGLSPDIDSVNNLNITLQNWLIDEGSDQDPNRLYALQNVSIRLNDYSYATPDSLYHLRVSKLNYNSAAGKLDIDSFNVVPRYNEMEFGKVAGYAKERYHIHMGDISVEGIDFPLYVRKRELRAAEMEVSNGAVKVFNNNALAAKAKVRNGKYPHQLLQQLKEKITIGILNLKDIDISYAEYDRDSKQKGIISFERTSGTITNITNVEAIKLRRPYLFANLSTYMMNQGKLDVNFSFALNATDGQFSYSGVLGRMDGKALNRVTVPLGMVQVKRGNIRELRFNVKANDQKASGQVDFTYNDLSVALLKKVKGESKLKRQGWLSLIANAMVINSDNPGPSGVLISAPLKYERPATASFFSFIWRTLFQGIKYSVGVTPAKEEKINAQIRRFEQIKIDREKRRIQRSKRKAERERR